MTTPVLRTRRLRWLARYFEEHPREYDQRTFCGTALCVGGLAVWQWGTDAQRTEMDRCIREHAVCRIDFPSIGAQVLGLKKSQADRLFQASPPWLGWLGWVNFQATHARRVAVVLRHLAKTGKVLR